MKFDEEAIDLITKKWVEKTRIENVVEYEFFSARDEIRKLISILEVINELAEEEIINLT